MSTLKDDGYARLDVLASARIPPAWQELQPSAGRKRHKDFLRSVASDVPDLIHIAEHPSVKEAVETYLGPFKHTASDIFRSTPSSRPPRSSQLYHLDGDFNPQVKVMVLLADTDIEQGPLSFIPAARSAALAEQLGYVTTKRVADSLIPDEPIVFTGLAGSILLIDTSRCFHFGSRVIRGERWVGQLQLVPISQTS